MKNKFDKNYYIITITFILISLVLIGIIFYKIVVNNSLNASNIYLTILFIICIMFAIYRYIKLKGGKK